MLLERIEYWFERALRYLAYAGGVVLIGLMFLIVYEVFMRYFYGRPFRGGYEVTELIMAIIVAFGLPYAAISRGHVSVDILARWLDRPSMRWLNVLVHLTGAALLAFVAWRSGLHAFSGLRFGDATNMMRIPKFPFQFAIAVSAGLFSLVLLLEAAKALRPLPPAPEQEPS
jgi:TRAP-type C4-dicarboxylate transport system permease small subunit